MEWNVFFERFFDIREDIRDMAGPRIGAIGPVTASAIRDRGIKVDCLAREFVAEGLLAQFSQEDVRGKRVLIPRAESARDILPDGIREMGGTVEVVTVYRTKRPDDTGIEEVRTRLRNKDVDAVTFTSSSTVTHFVDMLQGTDLPNLLDRVVLASIGPVTTGTVREHGLEVDVEASQYTIDGLVGALGKYFGRNRR